MLGWLVMYGYLNYSADLLAPYREWFGGAENGVKPHQMQKGADKALHGL